MPGRAGCLRVTQLAKEFPGDPQQQHPTGKRQADDVEQLQRDEGKEDAQHGRRADAEQDRAPAPLRLQPRDGQSDDDRVVAGEDDVDHDHEGKRRDLVYDRHQHLVLISTAAATVDP